MNIKGKRIAVTGGSGFLGSHLLEEIKKREGIPISIRSSTYNLENLSDAQRMYQEQSPDALIHSAAIYGGFIIHEEQPATIFDANMRMALNIYSAAIDKHGSPRTKKLVAIGSGCAYPGTLEGDMREDQLWSGPVDQSIRNYGTVKRMLETTAHVYRDQLGLQSILLNPATLYGERDTFNPKRSHVPSALIRKFIEAKQEGKERVEFFGFPETEREFIYVKDAATGIINALEHFQMDHQSEDQSKYTLNIGNGVPVKIGHLANLIADLTGFKGEIHYNGRSAGQSKKCLSVERMKRCLEWEPQRTLKDGLKKTIQWYTRNKEKADQRY